MHGLDLSVDSVQSYSLNGIPRQMSVTSASEDDLLPDSVFESGESLKIIANLRGEREERDESSEDILVSLLLLACHNVQCSLPVALYMLTNVVGLLVLLKFVLLCICGCFSIYSGAKEMDCDELAYQMVVPKSTLMVR